MERTEGRTKERKKREGETLDVNGVKEGRIAEGVGVRFIGTILRGLCHSVEGVAFIRRCHPQFCLILLPLSSEQGTSDRLA